MVMTLGSTGDPEKRIFDHDRHQYRLLRPQSYSSAWKGDFSAADDLK
jgi:hypothetical protein